MISRTVCTAIHALSPLSLSLSAVFLAGLKKLARAWTKCSKLLTLGLARHSFHHLQRQCVRSRRGSGEGRMRAEGERMRGWRKTRQRERDKSRDKEKERKRERDRR
eukprot:470137-Rhodomonas_salina.1